MEINNPVSSHNKSLSFNQTNCIEYKLKVKINVHIPYKLSFILILRVHKVLKVADKMYKDCI